MSLDGQELESLVTTTLSVWRKAERGEWTTENKGNRENAQRWASEVILWSTVFETGIRVMSPEYMSAELSVGVIIVSVLFSLIKVSISLSVVSINAVIC